MTQIVVSKSSLKKAEKRAEDDPLYSHKVFRNPTDVGRTIIEDYAKGIIVSQETIRERKSELENLVRNLVKDELGKNGISSNR